MPKRMRDLTEEREGKRVGIWVRVSPRSVDERKGADTKSESPEHHLKRAELYAEVKGWNVVEVYRLVDVSGKDVANHPETRRMLADIRRGHITGLIFSKLARLGRKTDVLINFLNVFREHDADLISIDETIDTTTPAGRNFFRFQASNAEWEREEIAERMQKSIEIRAKLGKQISGSSPFGYQWVRGMLTPHPDEAPVRRLMYELFLKHRRKRTVARLLSEMGHRTRKGGLWTPLTIERLLRDPTAKGLHRRNYTTRAPDNKATLLKPESEWEWVAVAPIVPEAMWEECNQILAANHRPQVRPAKRAVQLFAGVVFCGACNEKMYVPSRTTKYVCQKCRAKIPRDDLEKLFREQFRAFFLSPEAVSAHVNQGDDERASRATLLEQLTREQERLAREMDKTHRLYLDDAISAEGFKHLYRPLEERAGQLADELPRLRAEVDFLTIQNVTAESVAADGLNLFDHWDKLDAETKRGYVEALVRRIEVRGENVIIELLSLPPPVEHVANGARTPPSRTPSPRSARRADIRAIRKSGGRGMPRPYEIRGAPGLRT